MTDDRTLVERLRDWPNVGGGPNVTTGQVLDAAANRIERLEKEVEKLRSGPQVGVAYADGRPKQVWMPTHVFHVRRKGSECWIEWDAVRRVGEPRGHNNDR